MKAALSPYGIDIQMSQDTVQALVDCGYGLSVFKAVETSVNGAAPLVWFQTSELLLTTAVAWQAEYQAYISTDPIISNGVVTDLSTTDISLGQTAQIDGNGAMTATDGGPPTAISILNQASQSWTCGISQAVEGRAGPVCAVPLYGTMVDVITPVEQVLLWFSMPSNAGTVTFRAAAPGVLVDLRDAPRRTVQFDVNNGWSWDGESWAQPVEVNANLVPLLIQQ